MSHFCVIVIGENPDSQLSAFDESLELPMHQVATKEQIIANERECIKHCNSKREEWLRNPAEYAEGHSQAHIDFLDKEVPAMLELTDEEVYQKVIAPYLRFIADGDTSCEVHSDGSLWETYNDNGKWDYHTMGGRYRGSIKLKRGGHCDQARVKDIANLDELGAFAIVKEREWYERGKMGWWGNVHDEKETDEWATEVRSLLSNLSDNTLITIYDCHC